MRRLISVMFVVSLLALPVSAQDAQPSAEVSESTRQRARELFQEGVTHLDAQEWEAAREKFAEAYELVHEPSILLNLAHAQVEAGYLIEGAASYRRFLDEVRTGRLARNRRDAQIALNAVEARIPKIRINAPTLQEGDEITLDGAPFDRTQLGTDVQVAPGDHLVLVTRGDETYANESFTLAERERRTLDLPLTAPVAAPTPEQLARASAGRESQRRPMGDVRRRRIAVGVGVGIGVPAVLSIIAGIIIATR
jgi:hypothetical protein